ncbi:MAG: N-6 DNA methylase, partial [Eubacteriales bacterium]|nr:N-6 DNA methylase [Eubacteriales bacterium]
MKAKKITSTKSNGRIYTPDYIVDNILDLSGYTQHNVIQKHVIDNSCGDGAFLLKIVERYCKQAIIEKYNLIQLKSDLETYIHGIEI